MRILLFLFLFLGLPPDSARVHRADPQIINFLLAG